MPVLPATEIICWSISISLSRSGLLPSRIFGNLTLLIPSELNGKWYASSEMPYFSQASFFARESFRSHPTPSINAGAPPSRLKTPWRALNSRFSTVVPPVWHPTFICTFFPDWELSSLLFEGIPEAERADPAASVTTVPTEMALTKFLRSILFSSFSKRCCLLI